MEMKNLKDSEWMWSQQRAALDNTELRGLWDLPFSTRD